ncbi:hypothetical protein [Actinomadura logoneensis]|uniref:hypothetical protein n=1 Tax=Actinomadura logoneensis TaxID=2293572 RepID=UPI0011C0FD23|nr:hypothetical protein [Actinomadura logoneensis]
MTSRYDIYPTGRSQAGSVDVSSGGVLDFRTRTGRITGVSNSVGADGVRRTDRIDMIYMGRDRYELIPVQDRNDFGGRGKPWRVRDNDDWDVWTPYESSVGYVHDLGAARTQFRAAHRFVGMLDVTTGRTLVTSPEARCADPVLTVTLFIDDRTGKLIRYDRHVRYPARAADHAAGGSPGTGGSSLLEAYSNFGTTMTSPVPPRASLLAPRFGTSPGAKTFKYTITATPRPRGC